MAEDRPGGFAGLLLLPLLFCGALFGFFFAWVCSTMWGLDQADPEVAIRAMQAMNASVRNPVFATAFFGTAPVLAVFAIAAGLRRRAAAVPLVLALVLHLGAVALTILVSVPMNEALARVTPPADPQAAAEIWRAYSGPWQAANLARTLASGVALALVGAALAVSGGISAPPRSGPSPVRG